MAAPVGNKNAAKAKDWETALRKAIAQHKAGPEVLRKIADSVVDKALDGDWRAIDEIANRLDGKPAQSVELSTNVSNNIDTLSDAELAAIASGSGGEAAATAPGTQTVN